MFSLLVIDDELYAMDYHWAALDEDDSLQTTYCTTTDEAIRHYNADTYHLVVLDLFMPPGILDQVVTADGIQSGMVLYKNIRERHHLRNVPLLILTNYYRQDIVDDLLEMERDYNDPPLLFIRSKFELDPFQLRDEVSSICRNHPIKSVGGDLIGDLSSLRPLEIPDTEYPNVAPYLAEDVATGLNVRLYFSRFQSGEEDVFTKSWISPPARFSAVFKDRIEHPEEGRHVLKLMRHDSDDERIHGIYYTGGDSPEWFRVVLFEAAPWNCRSAKERELKHVGKIMVARFIRECMRRHNRREFAIMVGEDRLQANETELETVPKAKDFFQSLGFQPTNKHPDVLYLTNERAVAILNEVSPPIIL